MAQKKRNSCLDGFTFSGQKSCQFSESYTKKGKITLFYIAQKYHELQTCPYYSRAYKRKCDCFLFFTMYCTKSLMNYKFWVEVSLKI